MVRREEKRRDGLRSKKRLKKETGTGTDTAYRYERRKGWSAHRSYELARSTRSLSVCVR